MLTSPWKGSLHLLCASGARAAAPIFLPLQCFLKSSSLKTARKLLPSYWCRTWWSPEVLGTTLGRKGQPEGKWEYEKGDNTTRQYVGKFPSNFAGSRSGGNHSCCEICLLLAHPLFCDMPRCLQANALFSPSFDKGSFHLCHQRQLGPLRNPCA